MANKRIEETVHLDGGEFNDTQFIRCKIVYSGGGVPLLKNNLFIDCEWFFEGAAGNTIKFLRDRIDDGKGGETFVLSSLGIAQS